MTTKHLTCLALAALFSSVPMGRSADSPPVLAPPYLPNSPSLGQKTLKGIIRAISEQELTLGRSEDKEEFRVTLTKSVLITKGERPATIADLSVGETVRVALKKDTQEAASIEVLPNEPKPLAAR